jgi:hypothetical protein
VTSSDSEFYVGYLPNAPSELHRFVRRVIISLGLLACVLAVVLAFGQMPFARSYFEFGNQRDFEGTVLADPYPIIVLRRPGQVESNQNYSQYLLVAPGKHGADALARSFTGKEVHLSGQLIYRGGKTMVEVEPGSIHEIAAPGSTEIATRNLGPMTVVGEIVDSKCYLGVMNPGSGKVHRDCASRCLNGGIPPLFVEFASGTQFLLVAEDGRALPYNAIKKFIAEPLKIRGELVQRGDERLLKIDPRQLRHSD